MALNICFPFADGLVGGSHISAVAMLRELDQTRFTPRVVLTGARGKLGEMLTEEGIEFVRLNTPGDQLSTSLGIVHSVRAAAAYLRRENFDYVHTNEGAMHVIWGLAARLSGVSQIWHHRAHPRARGLRLVAPFTADAVVTVSRFATPEPSLLLPSNRCRVIHSPFETSIAGIDRNSCREAALQELGLDRSSFVVGFFAQFGERKRPTMFVDAIASAVERETSRPIYGLMFGEEFEAGFLDRVTSAVARHKLGSRIRLMGFRKPAETWMAACDALLVPAVDEPFGRTLVEAMLVGTPVVAAASGGNIEAIDDERTGILVQPDDPSAMADQLIRLANNPDLCSNLASSAQQAALNQFGVDKHVNAIEQLYQDLVA